MDPDRFEPALHALFDEFPVSPNPNGRRFTRILDEVPGLACENNLALLNLAASMLEPGESYVEVGSLRGTSLIAAMVGNEDADFVAIDDFSMQDASRKQLEGNVKQFGLDVPTIVEGDAFQVIPSGALAGKSVGVYYYDAGHSYEQQLDGSTDDRAVARRPRAADRRRHGLGAGRAGDARLPGAAAEGATARLDPRQGQRLPTLVGGREGVRVGVGRRSAHGARGERDGRAAASGRSLAPRRSRG